MAEPPKRSPPRRVTPTPPEVLGLPPYEDALRDVVDPPTRHLPTPPPGAAHAKAAARAAGLTTMLTPPEPPRADDDEREEPQIWVQRHRQPVKLDERLVLLREPDSWRSACYRVLRHRLAEAGNARMIAVSSAERGEGKTTCAANLALALGECERAHVLLVEANLRAPALASLFGYAPPMCLSQQLARHKHLPSDPWSVVEVFTPALHVVAMDPENGGRPLLDGPAFSYAMDCFRRAPYNYIVVDTPPVLGSADVNLIEDCVDGVLLTTMARRSSARALRRALEQLTPGRVLGVTLLDA